MDRSTLQGAVLACVLGLLAAPPAAAQDRDALRKPLVGKTPPKLVGKDADWLAGPPVTLAALKGKVVWLQFNHCEHCVSTRRELVRWEAEFTRCGLVVVEVSGGEATPFEASRKRLTDWSVRHPVLWDRGNANAKAYAIRGWPSAFLIGPDGKVVWQGNPAAIRRTRSDETAFRDLLVGSLRKVEVARK